MKSRQRLSTKFFSFGLGLLILALLSIGLTMWVTRQLDGGAAAVNEAGRLRMQTWRLASLVQATAKPDEIAQRIAEFDHSLVLLEQGDQHRPLFVPWNEQTQTSFARLQNSWGQLRTHWTQPQAGDRVELANEAEDFVRRVDELVGAIETTLARLTAALNLFQFIMMALAVAAAVVML